MHKLQAFANGSSANTKSSKTQSRKIGQSRGFLGKLFKKITKNRIVFNWKCT